MTGSTTQRLRVSYARTPTPEVCTLSLHDALPIYLASRVGAAEVERVGPHQQRQPAVPGGIVAGRQVEHAGQGHPVRHADRKSTRLNSSHSQNSYAVFCWKKKTKTCRAVSVRSADS